ncbi:outer membrane lipoprotein carrier protein [Geothermobacter ehrlichii]|uniref:Outer membrane lipoprotein carrier protein n=1 Tax=Geothermobacter ehrlichii TaxID=213224 RepID=A0A5D3WHB6_9BACT|nr:outer membrane lipoprotein carrier protein LolA [Geothermobacter ehrlichii]TYO98153.1 outer membrane lipoprotein carrier protein [Geothermobacter ehrlichii]
MRRLTCIWMVLLLLLPLSQATAASVRLRDVIQTLERPFRADTPPAEVIRDFEGEFFQESRIASLDQVQRGRGFVTVRFDRFDTRHVPRTLFRWEYRQPTNQEIISDGETLWVYLPENRQVIQSDIELTRQAGQEDPMTFLTGLGNISHDFLITWAEPNRDVEGNWILSLRPRRVSSLIREMKLVVDKDAVDDFVGNGRTGRFFPILSSYVTDPNGNTTLIEFSDLRINRGVSDLTFRFIIPAGVEVMRSTGRGMGF